MKPKIYPVIMCGGYGSRLWPLSRLNLPKQFIKIFGDRSLFQKGIERIDRNEFEKPLIISNQEQKYLLYEQLENSGIKDSRIFLEPIALSTAPVATIAALNIFKEDPQALMFLLSSDCEIKDGDLFIKDALKASRVSLEQQKYVLFGSKPQYPETGYGYIKSDEEISRVEGVSINKIHSFVEKPSLEEAKAYINSGYYWNSGIFVIPVKLFLEEMEKFSPDILVACKNTLEKSNVEKWGKNKLTQLNDEEFRKCPEDSIDYAVMEKTSNSAVIEVDMGWYDVGSWQTLYELSEKNEAENSIKGNVVTLDVKGSNIFSNDSSRLTAVLGLKNVTVVQTNDATLVMPTSKSQRVKNIVNSLKNTDDQSFLKDKVDHREWGYLEEIRKEKLFALYKIFVKRNCEVEFSGNEKFKHFIVAHGEAIFYIGRAKFIVKENDSLLVPKNLDFKIINNSDEQIEVLKTETKDYEKINSTSKKIVNEDA